MKKEKKERKEKEGKKKEGKERKKEKIVVTGKCKRAVARAVIKKGSGIIRINNKPIENLSFLRRIALEEPVRVAKEAGIMPSFDISIRTRGGGIEGQIAASRLAIARAILAFTGKEELRKAFLHYDRSLLVADTRYKEMRKPRDSKARAARQKSYR